MPNPSPGFARNPDKALRIEPHAGTVTVEAGGRIIARSGRALLLTEPPYKPVLYIPFADIDFSALQKTAHTTHCPYKGDASYWSVTPAGSQGANAMWAYETPYDETAAIKDHGAFYPDRVSVRVESGGACCGVPSVEMPDRRSASPMSPSVTAASSLL